MFSCPRAQELAAPLPHVQHARAHPQQPQPQKQEPLVALPHAPPPPPQQQQQQ